MSTFSLALVTAPAVIFLAAAICYHLWFRWWDTLQGRSMMGVIATALIMYGLNAVIRYSYAWFGAVADWWRWVEIGAYGIVSAGGILVIAALYKSKTQDPEPVIETEEEEVSNGK